jgi:hypothetical protein
MGDSLPFARFKGVEVHKIMRLVSTNGYALFDIDDHLICEIDELAYQQNPYLKFMRLSDGKHRRTSAASYGSTLDQSGGGSGGAGSFSALPPLVGTDGSPYTFTPPDLRPGAINWVRPSSRAVKPIVPPPSVRTIYQDMIDAQMFAQAQKFLMLYSGVGDFASMQKTTEEFFKIPKGETKFGELVGYRFWLVEHRNWNLWSFTQPSMWEPHKPMTGNPRETLHHGTGSRGLGVYAFKDLDGLHNELQHCYSQFAKYIVLGHPWIEDLGAHRFNNYMEFHCIGAVWGTVKLWGDVVEHETGYRAEYAKIFELHSCFGIAELGLNFIHIRARHEQKAGNDDKSIPREQ